MNADIRAPLSCMCRRAKALTARRLGWRLKRHSCLSHSSACLPSVQTDEGRLTARRLPTATPGTGPSLLGPCSAAEGPKPMPLPSRNCPPPGSWAEPLSAACRGVLAPEASPGAADASAPCPPRWCSSWAPCCRLWVSAADPLCCPRQLGACADRGLNVGEAVSAELSATSPS